jgi:hypothetical protein
LKAANVGLDVINAEFFLIYSYTSADSNNAVDVLYDFRTEIRVIRAQAYMWYSGSRLRLVGGGKVGVVVVIILARRWIVFEYRSVE